MLVCVPCAGGARAGYVPPLGGPPLVHLVGAALRVLCASIHPLRPPNQQPHRLHRRQALAHMPPGHVPEHHVLRPQAHPWAQGTRLGVPKRCAPARSICSLHRAKPLILLALNTLITVGIQPYPFGPINGARHDSFVLLQSGIVQIMRDLCRGGRYAWHGPRAASGRTTCSSGTPPTRSTPSFGACTRAS